jgi:hypothetical protein
MHCIIGWGVPIYNSWNFQKRKINMVVIWILNSGTGWHADAQINTSHLPLHISTRPTPKLTQGVGPRVHDTHHTYVRCWQPYYNIDPPTHSWSQTGEERTGDVPTAVHCKATRPPSCGKSLAFHSPHILQYSNLAAIHGEQPNISKTALAAAATFPPSLRLPLPIKP